MEKLKHILSPGKHIDDETMYGSGEQPQGKLGGKTTHLEHTDHTDRVPSDSIVHDEANRQPPTSERVDYSAPQQGTAAQEYNTNATRNDWPIQDETHNRGQGMVQDETQNRGQGMAQDEMYNRGQGPIQGEMPNRGQGQARQKMPGSYPSNTGSAYTPLKESHNPYNLYAVDPRLGGGNQDSARQGAPRSQDYAEDYGPADNTTSTHDFDRDATRGANTSNQQYSGTTASGNNSNYYAAPTGTEASGQYKTRMASVIAPNLNTGNRPSEDAYEHTPDGGGNEAADHFHGKKSRVVSVSLPDGNKYTDPEAREDYGLDSTQPYDASRRPQGTWTGTERSEARTGGVEGYEDRRQPTSGAGAVAGAGAGIAGIAGYEGVKRHEAHGQPTGGFEGYDDRGQLTGGNEGYEARGQPTSDVEGHEHRGHPTAVAAGGGVGAGVAGVAGYEGVKRYEARDQPTGGIEGYEGRGQPTGGFEGYNDRGQLTGGAEGYEARGQPTGDVEGYEARRQPASGAGASAIAGAGAGAGIVGYEGVKRHDDRGQLTGGNEGYEARGQSTGDVEGHEHRGHPAAVAAAGGVGAGVAGVAGYEGIKRYEARDQPTGGIAGYEGQKTTDMTRGGHEVVDPAYKTTKAPGNMHDVEVPRGNHYGKEVKDPRYGLPLSAAGVTASEAEQLRDPNQDLSTKHSAKGHNEGKDYKETKEGKNAKDHKETKDHKAGKEDKRRRSSILGFLHRDKSKKKHSKEDEQQLADEQRQHHADHDRDIAIGTAAASTAGATSGAERHSAGLERNQPLPQQAEQQAPIAGMMTGQGEHLNVADNTRQPSTADAPAFTGGLIDSRGAPLSDATAEPYGGSKATGAAGLWQGNPTTTGTHRGSTTAETEFPQGDMAATDTYGGFGSTQPQEGFASDYQLKDAEHQRDVSGDALHEEVSPHTSTAGNGTSRHNPKLAERGGHHVLHKDPPANHPAAAAMAGDE